MSLARYLSKLGAWLTSDGKVPAAALAVGAAASNIGAGGITNNELATLVKPLGVGQTWQDVTASRALGTTYTNSTGRPIFINVWCSTGSTTTELTLTVDGSTVTMDAGIWGLSFSAVIPSGSTYSASGGTKQKWRELL